MKKIMIMFLAFTAAPAFAETLSVSVPACFMREFKALEIAIRDIKTEAKDFCGTTDRSKVLISNTKVEQTADCGGFVVIADVTCLVPSK